MRVESLYRYPVKGLTPESLARAELAPARCIPWDRAFALAQGDGAFNPEHPGWVPKSNFMCLLKNARIAALKTRFDDTARLLHITSPEGAACIADPLSQPGQAELTAFLITYLGRQARYGAAGQPPAFVHVQDHSFCDHRTQVVSLIGLPSLRALEAAAGAPRDKRRFRANLYLEDLPPWEEFNWLGKTLAIGGVKMRVQERIDRCGATTVNPDTAERDANPVKELQTNFGHVDLGIFAEVLTAGEIKPGCRIEILG